MNPDEQNNRDILELKKPGSGQINYSVKAGAGAGKTTMLSERISQQIRQGVPANRFVIITYTNAAANELREKITGKLRTLLDSGLQESEKDNVRKALDSMELMQISTIHSFLFRILKENAFESGVALDAQQLDDVADAERKRAFFDQWYHDHYADFAQFGNDWVYTPKSGGNPVDHKRDVCENMFLDMADVREKVQYDTSDHSADFDRAADDYVKRCLPVLQQAAGAIVANNPTKADGNPRKLLKNAAGVVDNVSSIVNKTVYTIDDAITLSKAYQSIEAGWKKRFYGKDFDTDEDDLLNALPSFPGSELDWDFEKLYQEYMLPSGKSSKMAEYVDTQMKTAYQAEIDQNMHELSNDDILYRADQLFKNHPEVLQKVRDRYLKIYVDEFQDTTGVQADIIRKLSQADNGNMLPDRLVVVGDPKQSIYRFTGADIAVYNAFDADMSKDSSSQSVNLQYNFRSNKSIVTWVNNTFRTRMGSAYSPMDTDWDIQTPEALHGLYQYCFAPADPKDRYDKTSDIDELVFLIQTLVGNTNIFLEERDGSHREIRYSDIMIISKYTNGMSDYMEAFSENGIPVNLRGKSSIASDEAVKNYIIMLRYFADYKNRRNRYAAAQLLRGIDVTAVKSDEIKQDTDRLYELRKSFSEKGMDAASIAGYLLSHDELFLPKEDMDEKRVKEIKVRLYQMVESCLDGFTGDLSELCDLIDKYVSRQVRRQIPLESNEDAVRFMNVHQSKGLTANIVIIAGRSADEEVRYDGFRKGGNYYPSASFHYSSYGSSNRVVRPAFGWDVNRMREACSDETNESVRLEYVAVTRAAQALIVLPQIKGQNTWFSDPVYGISSLRDINQWIEDRKKDRNDYGVRSVNAQAGHPMQKLSSVEEKMNSADKTQLSMDIEINVNPSGLEKAGSTGYGPKDDGYQQENRPKNDNFGTVMHRVYELIIMRYDEVAKDKSLIDRLVNQAILEKSSELRKGDDPAAYASYLNPLMHDYFDKVITPILHNAAEFYPEFSFSFFVPDDEKDTFADEFAGHMNADPEQMKPQAIWVNGTADLVVRNKDGTVMVYDYKSDSRNGKPLPDFEKTLNDKYEGQLALYRYAIGRVFGVSDVKTELIHLYR